ncbi:MAG TPA: JAB domain-containing protein [Chlorobaculum parvum]|uniref:JAB domain-containing protein n=1 Tax=Chlorobaculum parvum TaxID=274539 RepID=A0A7C5H839_9CHLB|nr:JAB domain-containing protein [Chlorobaculum parvum]
MRIHDIDPDNRPRERFLHSGKEALSPAELLALILRSGTPNLNIIDTCNHLIAEHSLEGLADLSLRELQKIPGIGQAKAMQIAAVFELHRRIRFARNMNRKIQGARDVFEYMQGRIPDESKEHLFVLFLNTKNRILSHESVTVGTLTSSLIHPREIFKAAIRQSAHSIILVHNHPSGDVQPSNADKQVTSILKKSGDLLQIALLDHVIVGNDDWFSFRDHSLL